MRSLQGYTLQATQARVLILQRLVEQEGGRGEGGGWRDAEGGGMLVFGGPRHHALCILYLKV